MKPNIATVLFLLSSVVWIYKCCASRMAHEQRLMNDLLVDYDRRILPSETYGTPVQVKFDAELIRIIQINEREQFIEVYMWLRQSWMHPHMTWNVSNYGGIDEVKFSSSVLWLPDIVMYNSVDGQDRTSSDLSSYEAAVTVTPDGKNYWMKAAIFRSTCLLDVSHFPFDDQVCRLKFGSWTYDNRFIDLMGIARKPSKANYLQNGQWELRDITVDRNVVHYACCESPYVDVTMTISVRRNADSHTLNIVVPSAILSGLVLLTFILPPESGERVSLCITVLLAVTVFQQLTAQMMPDYGMPYLGRYYFATLIITAISLGVTTVILNIHHRSTRRTPAFVRRVVLDGLGRLLFCDFSSQKGVIALAKDTSELCMRLNSLQGDDAISDGKESCGKPRCRVQNENGSTKCRSFSASPSADDYELDSRRREWLKVARVLDRLFFIIFLITMIASFLAIFMKAPRFLG